MKNETLAKLWHYEGAQNVWQYAASDVDFSLEPRYETPLHIKYDPDYTPYWKEPVESLTSLEFREVVILKPSRAGCTEAVALNLMRYHASRDPVPMFYLGAQQESVERFFEERIVLGMRCCKSLRPTMSHWRQVGTRLIGDAWQITASYPGGKSSDKQFGYQLVIIDEASLCPPGTVGTLRKRLDTYRYGHLLILSSADAKQKKPSDEDAIFIEFEDGDKREWFCPDPVTGNHFVFRLGGVDTVDGVKWDKSLKTDSGWNLAEIEKSAYYVTPDGTRIENKDRMDIVRRGHWQPTNTKQTDPKKRSYHLDALCLPFINGDFGHYAVEFLKAVAKGQEALRVFSYEYQAEKFYGERLVMEDDITLQRQAKYNKDTRISVAPDYKTLYGSRRSVTLCSVDVQKDSQWYLIREWFEGGDSALVTYGETDKWDVIKAEMIKHGCVKVFIDNSYTERRNEVFEQCLDGVMSGGVPCFGRETLQMPYDIKSKDPFEGSLKQGSRKIAMITHNPDQIKHQIYKEIQNSGGHNWMIYSGIESTYLKHMSSEQCIDGAWQKKNRNNHLWDCEVLQLVGAMVLGIFHQIDMTMQAKPVDNTKPAELPKVEPTKPVAEKSDAPKCPRPGCKHGMVWIVKASQWQCKCGGVLRGQRPVDRWANDDEDDE